MDSKGPFGLASADGFLRKSGPCLIKGGLRFSDGRGQDSRSKSKDNDGEETHACEKVRLTTEVEKSLRSDLDVRE
jgi:hypothetical protein